MNDMRNPRIVMTDTESNNLRRLFNSGEGDARFLAYEISLISGEIRDKLKGQASTEIREVAVLRTLLHHFSKTKLVEKTEKLIGFRSLPGGHAYAEAFAAKAVQPIADCFGQKPETLVRASNLLGGAARAYGQVSVEIQSLPGLPLTYILWGKGEFPASANILFDESASQQLPTEDLAVLGEITTHRLIEAQTML